MDVRIANREDPDQMNIYVQTRLTQLALADAKVKDQSRVLAYMMGVKGGMINEKHVPKILFGRMRLAEWWLSVVPWVRVCYPPLHTSNRFFFSAYQIKIHVSEIYCKFRNFHQCFIKWNWSFVKIKPSQNGEITLLFTDVGKSCPSFEFSMLKICIFNAILENKILAKISKFTLAGYKNSYLIPVIGCIESHIHLLYTYNWYDFGTVFFLAIWYRKPDQQTEVFWIHITIL